MPLNTAAINGVIWSRERKPQFFTSNIFPIVFDEQIKINDANTVSGRLLRHPSLEDSYTLTQACITGGTLTQVIAYPIYDHPWVEEFQVNPVSITGGSLVVVIAYKTHDQQEPEEMKINSASITGGSLTVVINYVNYTNVPDEFNIHGASITGGTLV